MFEQIIRRIPFVQALVSERNRLMVEREQLQQQLAKCRCLPLPPSNLQVRVGGADSEEFLVVGQRLERNIRGLVVQSGRRFESLRCILDFGCGCGRVARHMLLDDQSLDATDIDPEAIAWCTRNLGGIAKFSVNGPEPPLSYDDSSFDLIYAISVFTHLPEEMALRWLKELRRILRPNGLVVTSILGGEDLEAAFPDDAKGRKTFEETGFYYTASYVTEGLPSFYGVAYHSREYVERVWGDFFSLSVWSPRAINYHQCGLVLQRATTDKSGVSGSPKSHTCS